MARGRVVTIGALGLLLALVMPLVALVLVPIKVAGPLPEAFLELRYGARFAVFCAAVMAAGALVCVCASIERVLGAVKTAA